MSCSIRTYDLGIKWRTPNTTLLCSVISYVSVIVNRWGLLSSWREAQRDYQPRRKKTAPNHLLRENSYCNTCPASSCALVVGLACRIGVLTDAALLQFSVHSLWLATGRSKATVDREYHSSRIDQHKRHTSHVIQLISLDFPSFIRWLIHPAISFAPYLTTLWSCWPGLYC